MNLIIFIFLFTPIIVFTAMTPYITRRTESFGVSIPETVYENEELKNFRKKYAISTSGVGIFLLITLMLINMKFTEEQWMWAFLISVFAYMIISFLVYLHFHKKMKTLKEKYQWNKTKKEVVTIDIRFYQQKRTYANSWFLLPLLINLATFMITWLFYDRIPDRFPMQYNFAGEVTRWADKSIGSVLLFPLLQLFMIGLFLFINIIIANSKQQIDPDNPEKSIKQNIVFRRRWSLFIIVTGTILVLLFFFNQLSLLLDFDPQILFILTFVIVGITLIYAGILTFLTGQGGSRVKIQTGVNGEKINRDDDRYWKLGIFYFNPNDPALFLEKRFGSGWTVNFARPLAWVFLFLPIVIVIIIQFFTS